MGNCYNVKKYISDYLENKLEPESRAAVENHLKTCTSCARSLNTISHLKSRLSSLRRYKCSDEFTRKLHERIHSPGKEYSQVLPVRKFSYAFTAVLVVFLSIYTLQWINNDKSEEVIIPASGVITPVSSTEEGRTTTEQQDVNIKTKESNTDKNDSLDTRDNTNGHIKYVDQQ